MRQARMRTPDREGGGRESPSPSRRLRARRAGALSLAVIGMFAIGMLAASAASASLPEWGGCEETPLGHGKYSNPACTVQAKGAAKKTEGRYEWYTGAEFGWVSLREHKRDHPYQLTGYKFGEFYAPIIGPTTFETAAGKKMECEAGSISFELENANTKGVNTVWLRLEGCQSEGHECASLGDNGEVSNEEFWPSEALKGELGFISGKGASEPKVGLSLTAFDTKSTNVEQKRLLYANCSGGIGPLWVGGEKKGGNAVISLLEPVNEMVGEGKEHTAFTQTFTQAAGVQDPSAFEGKTGGLEGNLENHFEPLGISAGATLGPEGPPIEIKATP